MERHEIINQTKQVFEYLQKLYLETSYFIKEVEGILQNEVEQFSIGRSGGYAVTSNRSSGLEPTNVELWLLRKMAVFFIPKGQTHLKGGQTITPVDPHIKILYLRVVLDGKGISEPLVYF